MADHASGRDEQDVSARRLNEKYACWKHIQTVVLYAGHSRIESSATELHFADSNMEETDAAVLGAWLSNPKGRATVTLVDISQNNIGVEGAKHFANALPASKVRSLIIGPRRTELFPTRKTPMFF